jgi:hypothetical protein
VLVHLSKNAAGQFSFNPLSVNLMSEVFKVVFALAVLLALVSGGGCWRGGRAQERGDARSERQGVCACVQQRPLLSSLITTLHTHARAARTHATGHGASGCADVSLPALLRGGRAPQLAAGCPSGAVRGQQLPQVCDAGMCVAVSQCIIMPWSGQPH